MSGAGEAECSPYPGALGARLKLRRSERWPSRLIFTVSTGGASGVDVSRLSEPNGRDRLRVQRLAYHLVASMLDESMARRRGKALGEGPGSA